MQDQSNDRTNPRGGFTRPELLSPAGDFESLHAALRFGADAVYLGGEMFGMRSRATNFKSDQLASGVAVAHQKGVKVYLACNTLPHNDEIDHLPAFLSEAADFGVDAFIVSDMGVLSLVKQTAPNIPVHVSVQAGVVNYASAAAFYNMGASRVVLARELTLEEIRAIREKSPRGLELEAFVHGAICVSHSGRCLLSDYMTGRDANRGDCAQPCRWKYSLVEEKRPEMYYPIEENSDGTYIMNANDLCMIRHIPELIAAGIRSFKIEGRAKSAYYTAVTTNAYRQALDGYFQNPDKFILPDWIPKELEKVSHRPYSTGFYFGRPSGEQTLQMGGYIRKYEISAVVEGYDNGNLLVRQRNRFFAGDAFDVLAPGIPPFRIEVPQMLNEAGEFIQVANHAMERIRIPYKEPLPEGSIFRKEISN